MDFEQLHRAHNGHRYRTPADLTLRYASIGKGFLIGSCFADGLRLNFDIPASPKPDYILYNGVAKLPELSKEKAREYRYQLIVLGLRFICPEGAYIKIGIGDEAGYQKLFDDCVDRMLQLLDGAMRYNKDYHLLTFVSNFMTLQQNPTGRLFPRYSLSNYSYFVERLNERLTQELSNYKNTYLLDTNAIASSFGKKHLSDENMWVSSHGTYLDDAFYLHDLHRMDKTREAAGHYDLKVKEFMSAIWAELLASYRVLQPIDPVKLVVIDLDDTLWRGVPAEEGVGREPKEGWPLGFAEALLYLKRRGIPLGIISKNDEAKVAAFWDRIYEGYIRMNDFAIKKINWNPKAENMNEMLIEANLLPQNVVFIDDNPVERAAMSEAFPEMRVLGQYPYYLRRILLWSAETQVGLVTDESTRRTQMMQAQVRREESRKKMSREEFLASLGLKVNVETIMNEHDYGFERALELLNKTNQFNTTGVRWTKEQMLDGFVAGVTLYTFDVTDKYTNYGIVGVAVVSQNRIKQFVMSCRVVGMDVELAVMPLVESCLMTAGCPRAIADFVETPANLLCRDLYKKCGYTFENGTWNKPLCKPLPVPPHVTLTVEARRIPQPTSA